MKRLAFMLLPLWMACGDASTGSHIGNPVSIGFTVRQGLSDSGEVKIVDETNQEYVLKKVQMNLADIRLRLPAGSECSDFSATQLVGATCEQEPEGSRIEITGPFVVDLLTGDAPGLNDVVLPPLDYAEVEYRIEDAEPEDGRVSATDPLAELSMYVLAEFTDESGPRTLELRLRFNEEMRSTVATNASLTSASQLVVTFDAMSWLANAGLGACIDGEVDEDPNYRLGEGEGCEDVEDAIKANIKGSGELRGEHEAD